jgi:hypothetical protein
MGGGLPQPVTAQLSVIVDDPAPPYTSHALDVLPPLDPHTAAHWDAVPVDAKPTQVDGAPEKP